MKRLYYCVLCLFAVLFFSSCKGHDYEYTGEYPALYTEAIHSLLWTKGISSKADIICDPLIKKLEEDNYGRILFEYSEKAFISDFAFSSLIVLQKEDSDFVYFYEDFNFICKGKETVNSKVEFNEREINELKVLNDWNNELDLSKCIKKEIIYKKKNSPLDDKIFDEIFSIYKDFDYHITYYLTEDKNGKFLCYSRLTMRDKDYYYKYVVVLVEPDLSYFIFEPTLYFNYQQELRDFKIQHNWQSK